jgi:hypothetical protein
VISDIIAIDPGTRNLGWARSTGGRITAAGCSRAPAGDLGALAAIHASHIGRGSARVAVVESMTYARDRPTTPQTLIDVQTVGCLVAAAVGAVVVLRRPDEWKTAVPKEIHHPRILAALDTSEVRIVQAALEGVPRTNEKEILDAVGILLHTLKRTSKTGEVYRP